MAVNHMWSVYNYLQVKVNDVLTSLESEIVSYNSDHTSVVYFDLNVFIKSYKFAE